MKSWFDVDHNSPDHDLIAKEMNKDAVVRQIVADLLDRIWPRKTKWDPSQIYVVTAASERIIKAPSGYIVGFIDHLVDAEANTINFLHLPTKRTFKFLFEIKPTVKSEGEVLRQINRYQSYYGDRTPVLVTKERLSNDAKNYFEKNGVLVYQFERDRDTMPSSRRDSLNGIRQDYPMAYAAWSAEEDTRLRTAYSQGKTIPELAQLFQRQPGGIRSRLVKLGLIK